MTTPTPNAAKPQRRWYQFSLRTLLIGVTLLGCAFAWVGIKIREGRQQQDAVASVKALGGSVGYDYEYDNNGNPILNDPPPGPPLLQWLMGDNFFGTVIEVYFLNPDGRAPVTDADLPRFVGLPHLEALILDQTNITDRGLECLVGLTHLRKLDLAYTKVTDNGLVHLEHLRQLEWLDLDYTKVTDEGLAHLEGLFQLQSLNLSVTKVTDAGVAKLQQALPNCKIER